MSDHLSALLGLPTPASHTTKAPESSLTPSDFSRVRDLIHQRAGIFLPEGKQAMVYSRLSRRLRQTGHRSTTSYLRALESGSGAAADSEWQAFVNCLTTNLTSFFREQHHFDALADDLRARRGQPLRIWCCAASTGEEPYSIAMTAVETLGPQAAVTILATDIDTQVLAKAERAVYPITARGLSTERAQRHFQRGTGRNAGMLRVRPELQRLVQFRQVNLMGQCWPTGEAFDFVFCRNVMIYFDAATQHSVLQRLHGVISPGALLYVGHSENFASASTLFKLRGQTTYVRI